MYFKLYKDSQGDWRWTLYAANRKKIADSAEGYTNTSDCEDGIKLSSRPPPQRQPKNDR